MAALFCKYVCKVVALYSFDNFIVYSGVVLSVGLAELGEHDPAFVLSDGC